MGDGCADATTLEEGVPSSCQRGDSRQRCACHPPKFCYGLSGVASEGYKECGGIYGPESLYAGAFLWDQLPTVPPSHCEGPWGSPSGTRGGVCAARGRKECKEVPSPSFHGVQHVP